MELKIIAIEIIAKCNLICDFCTRNAQSNDSRLLSLENIKKIIDKLNTFNNSPQIAITGGEPLMHEEIIDICKLFNNLGIFYCITTNGTRNNKNLIDTIARGKTFKHFIISLDSYNSQLHDKIRGVNAYKRTIKFIEYCKSKNYPFLINMTVNDKNYLDISKTIDLTYKLGAQDISIATVKPNGRGSADLDPHRRDSIFNQITAKKKEYQEHKNFTILGTEVTSFLYDLSSYRSLIKANVDGGCSFGRNSLHIQVDGSVLPCTSCEDISLGNIFDDNFSIKDKWNSNYLIEMRKKSNLEGICSSCEYKKQCGGCRCRAYGITGNINASDPYCPIVQKKNKIPIYEYVEL